MIAPRGQDVSMKRSFGVLVLVTLQVDQNEVAILCRAPNGFELGESVA